MLESGDEQCRAPTTSTRLAVLFDFPGSSTELVGSSRAELRHNPLSFQLKTRLLRARERERTRKGLQYYCWFIHPRTYISADEHESGELLLTSVVYKLC